MGLVIREALNAKDPDHGWISFFFVVALSALWIFRGRQLSCSSIGRNNLKQRQPVNSIAYEGSGLRDPSCQRPLE